MHDSKRAILPISRWGRRDQMPDLFRQPGSRLLVLTRITSSSSGEQGQVLLAERLVEWRRSGECRADGRCRIVAVLVGGGVGCAGIHGFVCVWFGFGLGDLGFEVGMSEVGQ